MENISILAVMLVTGLRRGPYKKLRYRRGTARRTLSVEILSTAAQLYEKLHLKTLAVGE